MKYVICSLLALMSSYSSYAGNAVSTAAQCALAYTNPVGLNVVGAVQIGKAAGWLKDYAHCDSVVSDTARIAEVFPDQYKMLYAAIHGYFGRCACKAVF